MYALDTNIIIYFLKGELKVKEFLREKTLKGSRFFISAISEAELFGYPELTFEEISKIDDIFKTISVISIDSQIARLAGFFKRKYKISLPDSIVAATSYLTNTVLLTRNIKDFKKIKEISAEFI
ncbi:type II toxin-antitoxin system VapC family toxin [Candidatus Gracilibacteria bacterium]|nr:type II toxin-antitoxin system VapC family toxin [Candidatus Gracilibacteria bacterium]